LSASADGEKEQMARLSSDAGDAFYQRRVFGLFGLSFEP
jgi:hypothetical protein